MSRLDELAADAGLTPQTKPARADTRPGQSTQHLEGTRVTTAENGNGTLTLHQRLAAIAGEVVPIRATGQNEYKRPAMSIGDVEEAVGTLLAKHRVLTLWRRKELERLDGRLWRAVLVCRLVNADAPDDAYEVEWEDVGSNPSAAYSFTRKGLYKAVLHLADDEEEGKNADVGRGAAQAPAAAPSGFTTPAQARQQPPQGRTPQPDRPDTCPKCGKTGTLLVKPDGGALCVAAKNGCGANLTREDFAAAAAPDATPAPEPPATGPTSGPDREPPAPQPAPTLAQQIAIACREIGITDTAGRDRLRLAVTGKEKNADLTEAEAIKVLKAAKSIGRGEARLENSEGAWRLVDIARGAA